MTEAIAEHTGSRHLDQLAPLGIEILLSEPVDVAIEGWPHCARERGCEPSVREDDRPPSELDEERFWVKPQALDVGDERLPLLWSG